MMLLHILLSLQLIITTAFLPKEENMRNDMKANMESAESEDEGLTIMMQRYAAYNHWANQQMANWLESASEEDLNKEIESSFSNLKETALHIWSAEYLWLQILKNEPTDNNPAKSFDGSKDDLLEGWLQASENFSNHVKSMSNTDLQRKRPRSSGDGQDMLFADIVQHCMNHSTYHRGQLITMGRQAGLKDPPRTDFIYYVSLPKE
jgi:uncharacterized damage-inducible protein DinB